MQKVCTQCGSVGAGGSGCGSAILAGGAVVVVSFMAYLVLWRNFLIVIAAVILACVYAAQQSVVRCKACGSKDLVPVDTPRGRKLIEEHGAK